MPYRYELIQTVPCELGRYVPGLQKLKGKQKGCHLLKAIEGVFGIKQGLKLHAIKIQQFQICAENVRPPTHF